MHLRDWDDLIKKNLTPETIKKIKKQAARECKIFKSLHKINTEVKKLQKLLTTAVDEIPCSWCLMDVLDNGDGEVHVTHEEAWKE